MSFQRRKVRVGRVVSNKMQKTVVVVVDWSQPHPLYGKAVRRRTRFMAHDERNECKVGDLVRIMETRPLSRTKRWRVVEIIERGELPEIRPEEISEEQGVAIAAAPAPRAPEAAPASPQPEQQAPEAGAATAQPGT